MRRLYLYVQAARLDNEPSSIEDPVWGTFKPPTAGYKPHQVLCISMCPCCIGPYCDAERQKAYKRIAKTASFVLSVIQLLLVLVSLTIHGVAPAKVCLPHVYHVW